VKGYYIDRERNYWGTQRKLIQRQQKEMMTGVPSIKKKNTNSSSNKTPKQTTSKITFASDEIHNSNNNNDKDDINDFDELMNKVLDMTAAAGDNEMTSTDATIKAQQQPPPRN
jgi:uncharacterized protein with gpF-like domain